MVKLMGKKIFTILCSKSFKRFVYLNLCPKIVLGSYDN